MWKQNSILFMKWIIFSADEVSFWWFWQENLSQSFLLNYWLFQKIKISNHIWKKPKKQLFSVWHPPAPHSMHSCQNHAEISSGLRKSFAFFLAIVIYHTVLPETQLEELQKEERGSFEKKKFFCEALGCLRFFVSCILKRSKRWNFLTSCGSSPNFIFSIHKSCLLMKRDCFCVHLNTLFYACCQASKCPGILLEV